MNAKDRYGDKNWEVYEEESNKIVCKCGKGFLVDIYTTASHEKVPKVERDFERTVLKCDNPNCPSKTK